MLDTATSPCSQFSFGDTRAEYAGDLTEGRPEIRRESTDALTRRFIRHPRGLPLHCREVASPDPASGDAEGGAGCGIYFEHPHRLDSGKLLDLAIVVRHQEFHFRARVCWIRYAGAGYEVGIAFRGNAERFRARMVEQICHIEAYRESVVRREGRILSGDGAAVEWISRYAASFPAE